jgi:hypothetical protein
MNNQSDQINELALALSLAQTEMQSAIKDKTNPFFKSKYADLGSVWDAARPVLGKHGLCVMQTTDMQGDKIIMITTLAHSSGQWIKSQLPLFLSKMDSQGIGAAMTYLRRYSLSALVGVVCDDDDDGETAVGRGQCKAALHPKTNYIEDNIKHNSVETISQEQAEVLLDIWKLCNEEGKKAMMSQIGFFGVRKFKDLPIDHYKNVLDFANDSLNIPLKETAT